MPTFLTSVDITLLVNTFFLFSFFGWCMEMVVIRREKGRFENRGFAKSPFCIIYGFGSIIGYALLKPFSANFLVLFLVGAICATVFEYSTARLMIAMFGNVWWDYRNKPFNYKGILCLESTIGWGIISLLLVYGLYNGVMGLAAKIPTNISSAIAFLLVLTYALDFGLALRRSYVNREKSLENNAISEVI